MDPGLPRETRRLEKSVCKARVLTIMLCASKASESVVCLLERTPARSITAGHALIGLFLAVAGAFRHVCETSGVTVRACTAINELTSSKE
jgi:hypothetical protein